MESPSNFERKALTPKGIYKSLAELAAYISSDTESSFFLIASDGFIACRAMSEKLTETELETIGGAVDSLFTEYKTQQKISPDESA